MQATPIKQRKNNFTDLEKSRHIYTVSEITQDIKIILENTFGGVWVEGEVSDFNAHPSGHSYFSLKDEAAIIRAPIFSRINRDIKFKIENGLKVICFGKISTYGPQSRYQIVVEKIEPKGIGAQQLAFEQLKNKLSQEGLFDPRHKKPLPLMPFRVGIVTSSAGAAVRDILQILKKGAPCVDVVIRSVKVQGEGAKEEIAEAIRDLNRLNEEGFFERKIEAIIVGRGGGSTEDLWAFNEEIVARAIYNSRIPTISAVGHQINVTLSDLAADVFVETPSAAAKIIVEKKNSLLSDMDSYKYQMHSCVLEIIHDLKNNLVAFRHMLKSPLDRLREKEQLLDELNAGLTSNIKHILEIAQERLSAFSQRLNALSPLGILSRGYSLSMLLPQEIVVKNVSQIKVGDRVKTVLEKGSFFSKVEEVREDG